VDQPLSKADFEEETPVEVTENQRAYWQKNLNITAILMGVWFVVTFVMAYFARDLNFIFFGWPFSFWAAVYARYMNELDQEHGLAEVEED